MIFILQAISLLFILATLLMWSINKKTRGYQSKFFIYVIAFAILMLISNIAYTLFVNDIVTIRASFIKIIGKINLALILVEMFVLVMYTLSKFYGENEHRGLVFPSSSVCLFEAFMVMITNVNLSIGSNEAIRGYSGSFTYAFVIINLLVILAFTIFYFKKTTKWFIYITILCFVVIASGAAIEYLFKINGIIEFSIIDAIIIYYLAIENPLNKIDTTYNCFKSSYIIPSLNRFFDNNINGFAVFIGISSDITSEQSESEMLELKKYLINEFDTVPEVDTFLSSERDLFIICDNESLFNDFIKDLEDIFKEARTSLDLQSNIKISVSYASNIHVAKDGSSLYRYLAVEKAYASNGYNLLNERYLDEKIVDLTENDVRTRNLIVKALNDDMVEVFYQPVYSTKEEQFLDAEALVRIRNTDGSIVMPGQFIKVAENTGLIIQLGERILEKVCQLLVSPETANLQINGIDINLSLTQCENSSLADSMISIVEKYKVDPSKINFEVTESNFGGIYDNLLSNLNKMRDYGFRLSLDDFGQGKTDVNYLVNTPITSVRIDRFVVWDYFDNDKTKTTVRQLIKLCHELNISVVATGIEKLQQLDEMAEQNVDYIQGYYFFKPMPEDEYIRFLKPTAFEVDDTKAKMVKKKIY